MDVPRTDQQREDDEGAADIEPPEGWEQLAAEPCHGAATQATAPEHAAAAPDKAAVDEYIVRQVQAMRPKSEADYCELRRTLPYPCFGPANSQLARNPCAWAVAGTPVLYVAWHLMPQLVAAFLTLGMPQGMPPCPHCWQHKVQLGGQPGRTLTVAECYAQLSAAQVSELQRDKQLGTTRVLGWLRTPYRSAGLGKPELLMAFQYKCAGCPGACHYGAAARCCMVWL